MKATETYNSYEILCTARTINEHLAHAVMREEEDSNIITLEGAPGSDFIIHIFPGEDGPEKYMHVKSGTLVATKPFMYTSRYFRCRVDKTGRLRAII